MKIKKSDYWVKCTAAKSHCFTESKSYKIIDGRICTDQGDYKVLKCMASRFEKLYTIQDLKDGKVAVDNRRSSSKSFSKLVGFLGHHFNGYFDYYYYRNHDNCFYPTDNAPQLPLQKVEDFLVQLHKIENVTESPYKEGTYMRWNGKSTEEVKSAFYEQGNVSIADGATRRGYSTTQIYQEPIRFNPIMSNLLKVKSNTPINPKHYSFNIKGTPCDLFDIGNAMDLNKEQFTALRYFRKKENQIEDTKKAIKCLERLVERLESEQNG